MIVAVWVFFVMGYETPEHPGVPYVQATASPLDHERKPEKTEQACAKEFAAKYPGVCVCDSGWHRQEGIKVMGG